MQAQCFENKTKVHVTREHREVSEFQVLRAAVVCVYTDVQMCVCTDVQQGCVYTDVQEYVCTQMCIRSACAVVQPVGCVCLHRCAAGGCVCLHRCAAAVCAAAVCAQQGCACAEIAGVCTDVRGDVCVIHRCATGLCGCADVQWGGCVCSTLMCSSSVGVRVQGDGQLFLKASKSVLHGVSPLSLDKNPCSRNGNRVQ